MPDLDFAGLAEEARLAFRPRFDEVVRRSRRRRWWLAGLATCAVALAGGGVAAGLAGGTASAPEETLTRRHALTAVSVGDVGHLYQLVQTCEAGRCRERFAVSGDRGARWTLREPPGRADPRTREILVAVNMTVVVVGREGGSTTHWVTTDAGRTWRAGAVENRPLTDRDRIAYVDGSRVVTVSMGLGRMGATPTPVPLHRARPFYQQGGTWGLFGYAEEGPVEGRELSIAWGAAGSRDWEVQPLPADAGLLDLASPDGVDVYALYGARDGALQMWVSRDGGREWARGALVPGGYAAGTLLATRDGTLWLSNPDGVLRSDDRGQTFTAAGFGSGVVTFDAAVDLYTASTSGPFPRVWVSVDGRSWAEAPR
ncbi:hypothetical protein [Asanoa sp. NPDC050611]|uniref:WD40/YVTN/BNR-like repeat-containing protein n=1 Tax=Asanoa sp. NPDC050611 TaxID=3157098 RepID=UPI0033E5F2A0